jgi:hypothetical protein
VILEKGEFENSNPLISDNFLAASSFTMTVNPSDSMNVAMGDTPREYTAAIVAAAVLSSADTFANIHLSGHSSGLRDAKIAFRSWIPLLLLVVSS